jgi:Acyclic terpene utilisation family protein AtuA
MDHIRFEQLSSNRVALSGVKFGPPPPITKIGITARDGFQAEIHWFLVGLDTEAKARMMEEQIRMALGDTSKFRVLSLSLNGSAAEDLTDENSATVDFRVFAQVKKLLTDA